jgi:hypothetical protein
MELPWTYDPHTRLMKVIIDDTLYYETYDGGQTINKYVNNELVNTIHKYGPDEKFTTPVLTGNHREGVPYDSGWSEELLFLSQNYSDKLGEFMPEWTDGFMNKNGELEAVGIKRGSGINNLIERLSVNRLCLPSKITEYWDWPVIASSSKQIDEHCPNGVVWRRHKDTGKIIRTSSGASPHPCDVFPLIHGPFEVDESDIALHDGMWLTDE